MAGRRGDDHLVAGDLGDAPGRCPEGEDITDAGLVDHLLVKLPDPPSASARAALRAVGGQEHPEQTPVGDRPAAGHRGSLGTGTCFEGSGDRIIDDLGAQIGEVGGGITPTDQLNHPVEGFPRQGGIRVGPPDGAEPLLDLDHPRVRSIPAVTGVRSVPRACSLPSTTGALANPVGGLRRHRHGLLRQHVQRIGHHLQRLQVPGQHPVDDHRRHLGILPVQRVHRAAGDRADGVAGASETLHRRGHARRCTDLHHMVHQAHVDAEFQGGRGHHAAQRAILQCGLDVCAFVLRHRPMVGPGDDLRGGGDRSGLRHELCRIPPGRGGQRVRVVFFGPHLVERPGESLGGASGVDEHQGGAVVHDLFVDRPLHMRPHRLLLRQGGFLVHPGGHTTPGADVGDAADTLADEGGTEQRLVDGIGTAGTVRIVRQRIVQHRRVAEVLDHAAHLHVPQLLRGWVDHGDRTVATEEGRHGVHRVHRRRQTDTLHILLGELVKAFQAQRQVCAPLRAGDGVDLVDDDGVDVAQRPARLRGQHEVQRFRGGDEDVRRGSQQLSPLGLRGVTGTHTDAHRSDVGVGGVVGRRGGAGDTRQRHLQVALDIHTEGLQWGDVEDPGAGGAVGVLPRPPHQPLRGQP